MKDRASVDNIKRAIRARGDVEEFNVIVESEDKREVEITIKPSSPSVYVRDGVLYARCNTAQLHFSLSNTALGFELKFEETLLGNRVAGRLLRSMRMIRKEGAASA